ncbi:4-diphosphocytidyl-2-C-methyl-D-erythritol kinase [Rhodobacter aestuarii]|uniref:4-diphosphocytidyl-2-C-methyl-D-erythritol kinase n=1 Tax=Rhodobacter aestuarii TaxID=453582 RepID=A0A1N7N5T8_9RHOB|nr:4-(cytidine 5'-diphospho)-2-C-methyl-D-erythritol kinase [Rhodobacter aestuarii]PTV96254.1 4-diphosphocytidyl-2-C-methyl-D-erythritol kinase [Rhodobacter aestuarii]SIS93722.1 4-diphosphocytidyl-2-C-methyl-D-erythritol kinase [Rhodobacter aestuarii]
MSQFEVFAPAKVNLALHVTGQREDGYHLLDSLVAFAPVGDMLQLSPAESLSLKVTGPESRGVPEGPENLVLKAAALYGPGPGAAIHLDKCLPAASGIGGGSSDAAAALRGMAALRDVALASGAAVVKLGADVPMCLDPRPARTEGIGEELTPVALPPLPAVLVNPRVEVSTPAVFKALASKTNPAMEPIPAFVEAADCIAWLARQRNDLQPPAVALAPVIAEVLAALSALPGCKLARMSGSGATCFGLFESDAAAEAAQAQLAAAQPGWWSAHGALGDQAAKAAPRLR